MNYVDCYCSMCGNKMRTTSFVPGRNYCCDVCYNAYKSEEKHAARRQEKLDAAWNDLRNTLREEV